MSVETKSAEVPGSYAVELRGATLNEYGQAFNEVADALYERTGQGDAPDIVASQWWNPVDTGLSNDSMRRLEEDARAQSEDESIAREDREAFALLAEATSSLRRGDAMRHWWYGGTAPSREYNTEQGNNALITARVLLQSVHERNEAD